LSMNFLKRLLSFTSSKLTCQLDEFYVILSYIWLTVSVLYCTISQLLIIRVTW